MMLVMALLLTAAPVSELREVFQREPSANYSSSRSMAALELCLGDAISKFGVPSALRGERETIVSAWVPTHNGAYARIVVHLEEGETEKKIAVRTRRGGALEGDLREALEACL